MRRVTEVSLLLLALVVAGCSSGGSTPSGQHLTPTDRSAQDKLAMKDAATVTGLGQEACDLLTDYHGDTAKVDAFFVKTAGEGGSAVLRCSDDGCATRCSDLVLLPEVGPALDAKKPAHPHAAGGVGNMQVSGQGGRKRRRMRDSGGMSDARPFHESIEHAVGGRENAIRLMWAGREIAGEAKAVEALRAFGCTEDEIEALRSNVN